MAEKTKNVLRGEIDELDFTFAVILEQINLDIDEPISCIIKYKYPLFGSKRFETKAFDVPCDKKSKEIEGGFWEHFIDQKMKESELEIFLSGEPLCLEVFNNDEIIGTAEIKLSKLFDQEAQMQNQQSFTTELDVLVRDDQGNQGSRIGYIDCLFALVKEKCIRCLFCTKIFKFSLIQKHLGQASNKDCKMAYSSDDIEAFKNESKKRRKEKELQRQRKKYDCDKRSEKHKKEYKQKERATKYQEKVKEKKEELQRVNRVRKSKFEIWFRKHLKDKTSSRYLSDYESAKECFVECLSKVEHLSLSEEQNIKIKHMKNVIEATKTKFESIVDETVEKAKKLSTNEMSKLYSKLYPTADSKKGQGFLFHEWHEIRLKNDLAFREIAFDLNEPYEWSYVCTCVKCSKAKKAIVNKSN